MLGLIGIENIVLLDILDTDLCEADVSSQILDVSLSKSIHIDPLVACEQIVNGLVVNTPCILGIESDGQLEVVNL